MVPKEFQFKKISLVKAVFFFKFLGIVLEFTRFFYKAACFNISFLLHLVAFFHPSNKGLKIFITSCLGTNSWILVKSTCGNIQDRWVNLSPSWPPPVVTVAAKKKITKYPGRGIQFWNLFFSKKVTGFIGIAVYYIMTSSTPPHVSIEFDYPRGGWKKILISGIRYGSLVNNVC